MFSPIFFGLLAIAAAAPRYHHHHSSPAFYHHGYNFEDFLQDEVFDTSRFWNELQREMASLEAVLADMSKRFPTELSTAKIEGNMYKLRIPLSGYSEKDIVVKAKKGLLMVQAVKGGDGYMSSTYMDIRSLPENVNEAGNWKFENGILYIEFPLIQGTTTDDTPVGTTAAPEISREDMENHSQETNDNADVGVEPNNRGDLGNREIETNEIGGSSNVEATTYAVDLKDEVEFVPVRY